MSSIIDPAAVNPGEKSLDRTSAVPLYQQLGDILRTRIEAGEWPPNTKIPSEHELNREYGLSRMTVRQVLTSLVNEGLLFRVQGKGTYVAPGKISTKSPAYTGMRQQLEDAGYRTSTEVIDAVIEKADKHIASHLTIAEGDEVVSVTRLRRVEDEPVSLHISHVPRALAPTLLDEDAVSEQLCVILDREYGLVMGRVEETLESTRASRWEGEKLSINPGEPLLLLRQQVSTPAGVPFEYTRILLRGDRIRLSYSYNL
ncbi:GntR family transcriptional regulator [Flaviflexus equikiangi]|uniref:GntR family transcriptional regulator n=1 Tax=Flaviflexus equikiangi TaxID=2758573 RepID=A0ABS2THL4_9ACTO|nr:GntR family transcriptional regulator [Flaviflexus equikiangi]MBM9433588.1 GntR family transcriptional regulator [Flaviflexus equikiangi]